MTTHKRDRPRRIDLDVQQAIEDLAAEGWGPSQIYRHLQQNPALALRLPATVKTVQRIVADVLPADTSGAWSLTEADGADAALVLPAVAALADRGNRGLVSKAQAGWIVKLRRACPDLPPWWAWRLSMKYLTRLGQHRPTASLDLMLSFAPWRDDAAFDRFARVVATTFPEWTPTTAGPAEGAVLDACRMHSERTGKSVEAIIAGWPQPEQEKQP